MPKLLPKIAEIKRGSLDDGPGIRSTVFFKGCPLSCVWCQNPECIHTEPELIFMPENCVGCGECSNVCEEGAIGKEGPRKVDRSLCTLCGDCTKECPGEAIRLVGTYWPVEKLVERLKRDEGFYKNSGGGVTLSGGEPTFFMKYTGALASVLKKQGIHVLIETCGHYSPSLFDKLLRPFLDMVYVDIKIMDPGAHRKYTGQDNGRILKNIEGLIRDGQPETLVRVPLIPDITATLENLLAIASFLKKIKVERIALLPYNPLWIDKCRNLSHEVHYNNKNRMTKETRKRAMEVFKDFELFKEI